MVLWVCMCSVCSVWCSGMFGSGCELKVVVLLCVCGNGSRVWCDSIWMCLW